jgi:thymidylate kinase
MLAVDHTTKGKGDAPHGEPHDGLNVGTGKAFIVEFVGPTGGGKTTNCQYFTDLLKKRNLSVAVFADVKAYFYGLKYYRMLYVVAKAAGVHGFDFLAFMKLLASHGIFSFDAVYRYMKLCVFNRALQDFLATSKVHVVLLDQWIIQGLWSATIFRLGSYGALQRELSRFYFKTDCVLYFDIDAVTASRRIGERNTGRSRFDKMNMQERLEESEKHNGYLFELYQHSSCENKHVFSTHESPAENAEGFLSLLTRLIALS